MVGMEEITLTPEAEIAVESDEGSEIQLPEPDGDFGIALPAAQPAPSRLPLFDARDPDEDEEEEEDLDFFDDEEEEDDELEEDEFEDEEFEEEEEDEEEELEDDDL
jgi:hypothetical protein